MNKSKKSTNTNPRKQTSLKTAREYYDRGCEHFRADKFDDAEADFTGAIRINEKFREAWVDRGEVYVKTEKHALAIENFNEACNLLSEKRQLFMPGEYSYRKALILSRIAFVKLAQKKYDEAIRFSGEAVKLMEGYTMIEDFAEPWYIMGMAWLMKGNDEEALLCFTKAAAKYTLDSYYENSLLERARLLQKSFKCKEAIDDYNSILQRNPDHVEALVERAGCWTWEKLETLGMPQRLEDLRRAVRISPEHPKALAELSNCLYATKQFEEAGEVAEKALKFNLEDEEKTERLGFILETAQRTKEAKEKAFANYHAFVNEYPIAKISSHKKDAPVKEEEFDKAIEETGRILHIDPNDVSALSKRAAAYIGKGNLEKSREDLETLMELQPDNSEFSGMRDLVEFF